jgi:hypothetical protein
MEDTVPGGDRVHAFMRLPGSEQDVNGSNRVSRDSKAKSETGIAHGLIFGLARAVCSPRQHMAGPSWIMSGVARSLLEIARELDPIGP